MVDLADRIADANERTGRAREREGIDEYGLPISKRPDYIAARVMKICYEAYEKNRSFGLLHARNGRTELWLGHDKLNKGAAALYRYGKINRILKPYEIEQAWDILLQWVDEIDETKIAITDNLYWDVEKGELCLADSRMKTIT